jgi:hypothetical protein
VVTPTVLSAGGADASSAASAIDPPAGGLPAVAVPTLAWTDCGDGCQGTPAQAPLDYHRPDSSS